MKTESAGFHKVQRSIGYETDDYCPAPGCQHRLYRRLCGGALDEAVAAARQADVAVIFAGLPDAFECEGYDRSHMRLPACQNRLIDRVAEVQPNTVVVLHAGSPVETPWADKVAAVLCMYLDGEGVGEATDALLYGDACPAGRLAESWPLKLEDNPSYLNFPGDEDGVTYAEGVYVGYRYYDTKKMAVRWPFGHGESYTTFAYSDARAAVEGDTLRARVTVTNTGTRFGKEVVQLYVADRTGAAARPDKELKAFAKVALAPGESATVDFTLDERALAWYSAALPGWYAAPGEYQLLFGHSSRDIVAVCPIQWQTNKTLPLTVDRNTTVGALLAHPRTAPLLRELLDRDRREEPRSEAAREAITEEMLYQMMVNSPLRSVQVQRGESDAWLQQLVQKLQAAVDAPTES